MVFKNSRQRKGFFGKIADLREKHRQNVQSKLQQSIKQEQKELDTLNAKLKQRQLHAQVEKAKQQQVIHQREQLASLKKQEKDARKRAFDLTKTGRVVNVLKKEAGVVGTGIKKFATSPQTKSAIKKIEKELLG